MIEMKHILVPIDFSDHSKKSLRYATAFATQFGADITLIFVVEPVIYPADFSFGQVAVPAMERELFERGEAQLRKLIEQEVRGSVPAHVLVRTGKPFIEITRAAAELAADLIIIATHGHTGIEHVLFGSTAEKVVRKAPCPVLTLRDKEQEFVPAG